LFSPRICKTPSPSHAAESRFFSVCFSLCCSLWICQSIAHHSPRPLIKRKSTNYKRHLSLRRQLTKIRQIISQSSSSLVAQCFSISSQTAVLLLLNVPITPVVFSPFPTLQTRRRRSGKKKKKTEQIGGEKEATCCCCCCCQSLSAARFHNWALQQQQQYVSGSQSRSEGRQGSTANVGLHNNGLLL
jgi:hypothetical protein